MIMDAGSLLVCVCVFVCSGGLLLAVSLFGVRERSYDELLAERRALAQCLAPKRPHDKRAKKQQGRKPKEKERQHVEFQEEPVIATEPNKKQARRNKVRSILLNKTDGRATNEILAETSSPQCNHFEQIHPKDELELHTPQKHDAANKEEPEVKQKETKSKVTQKPKQEPEPKKTESKPAKQPEIKNVQKQEVKLPKKQEIVSKQESKKQKTETKQQSQKQEPVAEAQIELSVVQKQENESRKDNNKSSNKQEVDNKAKSNKVKHVEGEQPDQTKSKKEKQAEEMEIAVKETESQPSAKDKKKKKGELNTLQQLQSGGDTRHDVAVSLLIATVRKAELSRGEIQLLIDLLLNKQHEAPVQLAADWSQGRADPVTKLKKQLADRERALVTEQETTTGLQARLRDLRVELNTERSAHTHAQRALEEARQDAQLRQRALAQQLRQREDMVRQQRSEDARTLEIARAEVERYVNAQAQVVTQLRQREEEMTRLETERARFESEKAQLVEQREQVQAQLRQRELDFLQLEKELAKMEAERAHFESKTAHFAEVCEQESLNVRQRESDVVILKKEAARLEKEIEQLQSNSAEKDVARLEAMLAEQREQMQVQLHKRDESMRQLENEIARHKAQKEEQNRVHQLNLQNEITSLRVQLKSEAEKELQLAQNQLEEQRSKNDELRKKNWKVMEALNNAESALRSKTNNTNDEFLLRIRSEEQENKRQLIQRLFPEVKTGDETDALKYISELRSTATTIQSTPTDMPTQQTIESHSEVEQLRTKLTHYRAVVSETEAMLASLEAHVKAEERRWRNELATRDAEIQSLRDARSLTEELERQLDVERRKRQLLEDQVLKYNLVHNAPDKQNGQPVSKTCLPHNHTANGTADIMEPQVAGGD